MNLKLYKKVKQILFNHYRQTTNDLQEIYTNKECLNWAIDLTLTACPSDKKSLFKHLSRRSRNNNPRIGASLTITGTNLTERFSGTFLMAVLNISSLRC